MSTEILTQSELKELLHYDPESGIFVWLCDRNIHVCAGSIAGSVCHGYIRICVNGRMYQAHRLAFLYMEGEFPPDQVDHINHVRSDNRWSNIRHATVFMNQRNREKHSNNTSGHCGVRWHPRDKRWIAQIAFNLKRIHLGNFIHKKDAVEARREAEIKHGFHENHGKQKRTLT